MTPSYFLCPTILRMDNLKNNCDFNSPIFEIRLIIHLKVKFYSPKVVPQEIQMCCQVHSSP